MLWTVKQAARFLGMEPHHVYYLLVMGEIEAVKIGDLWRLEPEAVKDYARRFPERTDRKAAGNFIYCGDGGFLFLTLDNCLPSDTLRQTAGMERRRRPLVHSARRPKAVLLKKFQSLNQFELFTS